MQDVVLAYPDYSKEFEMYTDTTSEQIGAVITQGNKPKAYFNRKLTETKQHYSVIKIELLIIVETLKDFKGMLWGQKLKVFTDHKSSFKSYIVSTHILAIHLISMHV